MLASLVWTSCGRDRQPEQGVRVYPRNAWDTLWIASPATGVHINQPYMMAADSTAVYVYDFGGMLNALRLSDGSVLWRAGRSGSGPGEFVQAYWISVLPAGNIGVLDRGSRRLVTFSPRGEFLGSTSLLRARGNPQAFCRELDGNLVVAPMGSDSLVELTASGAPVQWLERPWNVHDPYGALNQLVMELDNQSGTCALAMMIGGGFAFLESDTFRGPYSYIDRLAPPVYLKAADGRDSASHDLVGPWDLEISQDTLWMLYTGVEYTPGERYIDAYNAQTGAYLLTLKSPRRSSLFVKSGDIFVFRVKQEDDTDVLLALRRSTNPQPERPERPSS